MSGPWRAMMLVGVLTLAACDASADASVSGADAAAAGVVVEPTPSSTQSAVPLVDDGFAPLVAMRGPSNADGTLGAGCAEHEGPLDDGPWFAFVLDYSVSRVTVDIACVYGEDTVQWDNYAATYPEGTPVPHHVVINDVVVERELRLAPDAEVYLEVLGWQSIDRVVAESGLAPAATRQHAGVWVCIDNGVVTAIVQPYAEEPVAS